MFVTNVINAVLLFIFYHLDIICSVLDIKSIINLCCNLLQIAFVISSVDMLFRKHSYAEMQGQQTIYGSCLHFLNLILWMYYLHTFWQKFIMIFFVINDLKLICHQNLKFTSFVTNAAKYNSTVYPKRFIVDISSQLSLIRPGWD